MMPGLLCLAALMTIGVETTSRPVDGVGVEFVIRVDSELLENLRELPPSEQYLESLVPKELGRIDRVRVELASDKVPHTVLLSQTAKPLVSVPDQTSNDGAQEQPAGQDGLVPVPSRGRSGDLRIDQGIPTGRAETADLAKQEVAADDDPRSAVQPDADSDAAANPVTPNEETEATPADADSSNLNDTQREANRIDANRIDVPPPGSEPTDSPGESESPSDGKLGSSPLVALTDFLKDRERLWIAGALLCALCFSLGGNLYQMWIHGSLRSRYRDLVLKGGSRRELDALERRIKPATSPRLNEELDS
jgi:hypothetical protein